MRGEEAYRLRGLGLSWKRIAKATEYDDSKDPESAVLAAAKLYAERLGLPWPLTSKRIISKDVHSRQRKSYRLREKGLSWKDIAVQAGYSHAAHACEAAGLYAHREGKPWPLRKL